MRAGTTAARIRAVVAAVRLPAVTTDAFSADLARARALVQAALMDPDRCDAHLAAAEALLAVVAEKAQDRVAALTCLGAVLCDRANYPRAVEVLQRAVGLGSQDRNTYFNLGIALLNSGKRRQAMACFRQASLLRASPLSWEAYFDPHAQ